MTYYDSANLSREHVTIFTPLAGRDKLFPGYIDWLLWQTWPRHQTSLLLLETVPQEERVLNCMMLTEYPDVRIACRALGSPEALAMPRDRKGWQVIGPIMAQIYGWMRTNITTDWVLVVEDDVLPPKDVIDRLMRSMDADVASVSAAVPFRDPSLGWIAWGQSADPVRERRSGVQPTGGNGWGCVLLRTSAIKARPISANPPFDRAFYSALPPLRALLDWDCVCEHRNA